MIIHKDVTERNNWNYVIRSFYNGIAKNSLRMYWYKNTTIEMERRIGSLLITKYKMKWKYKNVFIAVEMFLVVRKNFAEYFWTRCLSQYFELN